jgi:hypothetical protein
LKEREREDEGRGFGIKGRLCRGGAGGPSGLGSGLGEGENG